jgi:hemerythrin-like domain-containing protein
MTQQPKPNLAASLLAIHAVISRGLDVASTQIKSFAELGFPDASLCQGILNYLRALSSVLHGHHLAEEELAFPYFRVKMPDVPFDLLLQQHQQILPILEEIECAIPKCADEKQQNEGLRQLGQALDKMIAIWHPHIRIEEEYFTQERFESLRILDEEQKRLLQQIGEHSQKNTGPPYLVLPFMLYNVSPEARARLAGEFPPEVIRHLVPVAWKDQWASMKPFLLD